MKPVSQEVEATPDRIWLDPEDGRAYVCDGPISDWTEYIRASQVAEQLEQARADVWERAIEIVKGMEAENIKNHEYWASIASEPKTDLGVLKWVAWSGEDSRVIAALESARTNEVSK